MIVPALIGYAPMDSGKVYPCPMTVVATLLFARKIEISLLDLSDVTRKEQRRLCARAV